MKSCNSTSFSQEQYPKTSCFHNTTTSWEMNSQLERWNWELETLKLRDESLRDETDSHWDSHQESLYVYTQLSPICSCLIHKEPRLQNIVCWEFFPLCMNNEHKKHLPLLLTNFTNLVQQYYGLQAACRERSHLVLLFCSQHLSCYWNSNQHLYCYWNINQHLYCYWNINQVLKY